MKSTRQPQLLKIEEDSVWVQQILGRLALLEAFAFPVGGHDVPLTPLCRQLANLPSELPVHGAIWSLLALIIRFGRLGPLRFLLFLELFDAVENMFPVLLVGRCSHIGWLI